jgi:hypothetical protein
MKIDLDLINKIFDVKVSLKKATDKNKLSHYSEYIPMYDIRSKKIYPINKKEIHFYLLNNDYRFINEEIRDWIKNNYKKYNDNINKNNLEIIKNYNIDLLLKTCYKTLYEYSPFFGLEISICRRNSFHPYIYHLKPYYSKLELIKLGQNMELINKNIKQYDLLNKEIHYDICKRISKTDISNIEIFDHHKYICENNLISWICFYSFVGSFLFNNYLRFNKPINEILYKGLYKILKIIENSPPLNNNYQIYRFVWDDNFIKNLDIGDIYFEKGFMSTTRDPFYNPGLNGDFGLILIKINIPKNIKGLGLFIENYSLFPKEEEFIMAPYSKFKLISKNENFKYYHINEDFEKLINKKYEFDFIEIDYNKLYKNYKPKQIINNYKYNDLENINLTGIDRVDIIKQFTKFYGINNIISISFKNNNYNFLYQWFDSSNNSAYTNLFYNKIKDGLHLFLLNDDGFPLFNIEIGQYFCINYLNKFYFGCNETCKFNTIYLDLINELGRIFYYNEALIFHEHVSFIVFNKKYNDISNTYLLSKLFNRSLYDYLKTGEKYLDNNKLIKYTIGYWYLDEYFKKKIDNTIIKYLPEELKIYKNNKELFINVIEKHFYFYPNLTYLLDSKIFKYCYVTFKINNKNIIEHSIDEPYDENYNLIFRQQGFKRIS